eukprot:15350359-Ditylum_brightwellii.AAC.1
MHLVAKLLEQYRFYPEAEIQVTALLVRMVKARQWMGNQMTATFATATKGLTPFSMGEIEAEKVAVINDIMEAISKATITTAQDIKSLARTKA